MPEIRIVNGSLKGQIFDIADKAITIGRDDNCTIQIMDKGASRKHAEIFRIGEMCFIRDFKSRNGTILNDERIEEELLRDGDTIKIGETILDFYATSSSEKESGVEFFDEEDSSASLELDLADLTDLNASQGDGADMFRLRSLYKLGQIIDKALNEKSLIDAALPLITDHFNSEMTYLFLHNSETEKIEPIGSDIRRGEEKKMISRSIIKRAIEDKMAILTTDATRDGPLQRSGKYPRQQDPQCYLCSPLPLRKDKRGYCISPVTLLPSPSARKIWNWLPPWPIRSVWH